MAINSRKISSFPSLSELTGGEYVLVSYNNRSYKIPTSMLIGTSIESMTQKINAGDGQDNPITIVLTDGTKQTFTVKNGAKGSKGEDGKKGEKGDQGDSGVAIYSYEDFSDLIINSLDGAGHTDKELASLVLSAAQGVVLGDMADNLKEVYLDTQAEYDALESKGLIDETVKYLIFEE